MALLGVQEPRLSSIPDGDAARGDAAVAFARFCGLTLYPWQEDLLRDMCRTDDAGNWAAREVVTVVARQNGKGEVLVARELAGVYLFGEKMIFHSAHFMDTAIDAQKRLWEVIASVDELMTWFEYADQSPDGRVYDGVPRKTTGNGKESITFPNGAQILFRTRTKKTGRGLSVELLILDECFDLPNETFAALGKLVRAKERAQTVFISSPVNRLEHMHGAVFSAKRWAGIDGAKRVLFKEWSPAPDDDPFDPGVWAACNPSMVDEGPGAQVSDIEADANAAKNSEVLKEAFMVETLAAGNWVPRDGDTAGDFILDLEEWSAREVASPVVSGDSCMAMDVTPNGERVAMVAAVRTTTGVHLSLGPLERFDRDEVVSASVKAVQSNDPVGVVLDPKGPASTLVSPLVKVEIEPYEMKWAQVSAATELFMQMFAEGRITHDGDPRWLDALKSAAFRPGTASGRALTRTGGSVCELVAATFAVWGLVEFEIPDVVHDVKRKTKFVGRAEVVPTVAAAGPVVADAREMVF